MYIYNIHTLHITNLENPSLRQKLAALKSSDYHYEDHRQCEPALYDLSSYPLLIYMART